MARRPEWRLPERQFKKAPFRVPLFFIEPLSVNYYAPMARRPEGRLPFRQFKKAPIRVPLFFIEPLIR